MTSERRGRTADAEAEVDAETKVGVEAKAEAGCGAESRMYSRQRKRFCVWATSMHEKSGERKVTKERVAELLEVKKLQWSVAVPCA